MAGKGRLFRRGQNHRELPGGATYHYKGRNKEMFRNLLTAQNAPPPLLRGCAGGSDRRERKATPKGVFDWTLSGQSGSLLANVIGTFL